ncbi:glycosyltransferase family 2 protein [Xenorhabdus bovienii]|uniref:glycosyltransferase family 2 protein n=1 Tax=Xenorhabdus bovienii TaxID=40576 RepID=UPI0023B335B3|nr:glycosyltransferase family 2 protein [Xenorhabdus bovienii]MDE9461688.1 glycosyltransferase [Xenorhabdus bovienii]MDE9469870.1 glycosyltransferase [Xenorhabdus bovienii]MDE9534054.1 glycosyltransferase [Xenorhabdus bovienii]MDE9586983.1 glycosyltransferase [Xenorhabdus bovienii]
MFLSICIPSYNRFEYLIPLLDSIYNQAYAKEHHDFEVIICEDVSPQRERIISEYEKFVERTEVDNIRLVLNQENLGYDKNLRNCIAQAKGKYCMIMGNDDLLNEGALLKIITALKANPEIVVATRAYAWFKHNPKELCDTIRHLPNDKLFESGLEAIRFFFRRVGVISGFIVNTQKAQDIATEQFDGRLYYQMYLAGSLLTQGQGYYFSNVMTLSRDSEAPDFGNAKTERSVFTPGGYKPEGRLHMVGGLLEIAKYIEVSYNIPGVYQAIKRDISNYFYPYIRDQLSLPFKSYIKMVKQFRSIGFYNEPLFYIHIVLGYLLKKNGYDKLIKIIRCILGGSPRIGI